MTRALVLGGGGPVGIGWECGLVTALAEAGVVLADADLVVGTSAGSVVGAGVTLGLDLGLLLALSGAPLPGAEADGGGDRGGGDAGGPAGTGGPPEAPSLEAVMTALGSIADGSTTPEAVRRELGRISTTSPTVPESAFLGAFAAVAGAEWPANYRCTAVDCETGEFRVWDAAAGVDLPAAIASSCSVPGIFPPITIAGRRYMDGGMRTALNADVALGHDAVVAVSCFTLSVPEGFSTPAFEAITAMQTAEFTALRDAGSTLEVVSPGEEFLDISGWGLHLMDPSRVGAAYEAGCRQGAAEAGRLAALWNA